MNKAILSLVLLALSCFRVQAQVRVGFPEAVIEAPRDSDSVEVEVRLLEGTLESEEGIPLACFTQDGTATGGEDFVPIDLTFAITAENTSFKSSIEILQKQNEEFTVQLALLNNFDSISRKRSSSNDTDDGDDGDDDDMMLNKPPDTEIDLFGKVVIRLNLTETGKTALGVGVAVGLALFLGLCGAAVIVAVYVKLRKNPGKGDRTDGGTEEAGELVEADAGGTEDDDGGIEREEMKLTEFPSPCNPSEDDTKNTHL